MTNVSPYFLPIVFIIVCLVIVAVGIAVFVSQYKNHQAHVASLNHVIDGQREQYIDLLGRVHGEKNLPPPGVNLQDEYEQRKQRDQEQRIERRNGGAISRSIGPVDDANERALRDLREQTAK